MVQTLNTLLCPLLLLFEASLFVGASDDGNIPRVIIQTAPSPATWSEMWQKYHSELEKRNTDFDVLIFDDDEAQAFIDEHFANTDLPEVYRSMPLPVLKSDLFRLAAVYILGGFYVDMDVLVERSFEPLVVSSSRGKHRAVFPKEWQRSTEMYRRTFRRKPDDALDLWQVGNYAFGAAPGHSLLRDVLDEAMARASVLVPSSSEEQEEEITLVDVLKATGPYMLSEVYHKGRKQGQYADVSLLEGDNKTPMHRQRQDGPSDWHKFGPYAEHMMSRSWLSTVSLPKRDLLAASDYGYGGEYDDNEYEYNEPTQAPTSSGSTGGGSGSGSGSGSGLTDGEVAACLHAYSQCADKFLTPDESTSCFDCVLDVTNYVLENVNTLYTCELISEDTCPRYTECNQCDVCTDEMVQGLECLYEGIFGDDCEFDCPDFNFRGASENKAGVIAGIVVAVVAVLGAVTRAVIWCVRSRKRKAAENSDSGIEKEYGNNHKPTPTAVTTSSYTPTAASSTPTYPSHNVNHDAGVPSRLNGRPSAPPPPHYNHTGQRPQHASYSANNYRPGPRQSGASCSAGGIYNGTSGTHRVSGGAGTSSRSPNESTNNRTVSKKTTRRQHADGHESIIVTEGHRTTTSRLHPDGNQSIIIEER